MPKASIVVPSRGGRTRLPLLFSSLAKQTEQDVEMIVVLDGDIDDSEAVVREAAADVPVRSIVFPENRGRAAALNAGFFDAAGDVLIRADDDLELEPDFVAHHVRLHEEAPRGVIAMCRDIFPETDYATAYGIEADVAIRTAAFETPPDRTWEWWSGNVSTTRDDFHAVGGYDESFREYGWEDVEWGYRLHQLGRDILIAPGFETLHHGPVTSATERFERAFASGAAYAKFIEKHGSVLARQEHSLSLWNSLVAAAARGATPRTVRAAGRLCDRYVGRLPHALGHKAIALGIQASSRGGRRRSGR
ncbi:glycosyltransferase family 2 protein [Nocardioides sp. Soil774]|uniref:glycosyltransferase family 2 protein n=1 Tax=Nocardioides sp. Soil774 TaxID=1736408 RepID=UPI000ABFD57A|nr:glycosyltransferase family 2 protein [Nocardioides sp. Soil774]